MEPISSSEVRLGGGRSSSRSVSDAPNPHPQAAALGQSEVEHSPGGSSPPGQEESASPRRQESDLGAHVDVSTKERQVQLLFKIEEAMLGSLLRPISETFCSSCWRSPRCSDDWLQDPVGQTSRSG
jgi:hypothetical protein